jgi:hypothetical protein
MVAGPPSQEKSKVDDAGPLRCPSRQSRGIGGIGLAECEPLKGKQW